MVIWLVNLLLPAILIFVVLALVMGLVVSIIDGVRAPLRAAWSLRRQPIVEVSREDARLEIKRAAESARMLCSIAYWCSIVGLVALILVVGGLVIPNLSVDDNGQLVMKSLYGLGADDPTWDNGRTLIRACLIGADGMSLLPRLVELGMGVGLFRILRGFFGAIVETGCPFEAERAEDLRRAGACLLQMGIVPALVGNIATWALLEFAGFAYGPEVFSGMQGPSIALGVFVCAFAQILRYGCILQQQDDGLV